MEGQFSLPLKQFNVRIRNIWQSTTNHVFWMWFPVPSLKHLAAWFLHHQEAGAARLIFVVVAALGAEGWVGHSLNDRTVIFVVFCCGHPKLQIRPMILISLECVGSHKRNGTSSVCIRCMVLEIQLFLLIHAFQKVVALCFRELGPHKSRKTTISRTLYVYLVCTLDFMYMIKFTRLSLSLPTCGYYIT